MGLRSHGPNSFNFVFIEDCWHFLNEDISHFIKDFHSKAKLSKAITSYFLTLVSQSCSPLSLDDYKPTCLVGSLYKILSKIFWGRLKKVLGSLVARSQSTFVPGR